MERQDVAYFVNSTPKYFFLLKLHFTLLRRYAEDLKWPVYMVSEKPGDPILQELKETLGVEILEIPENESFFLESRLAACKRLPKEIKYILPIQEDFLLGSRIDAKGIEEALTIFDTDSEVVSIRLMPCPGPKAGSKRYKMSSFLKLEEDFLFTFQATLWKREAYELFLSSLLDIPDDLFLERIPNSSKTEMQRKKWIQVDFNLAENTFGQRKIKEELGKKLHLGWPRAHVHPNAVFLCPWPYRPTAVEKGKVGDWVYEFAKREGVPI